MKEARINPLQNTVGDPYSNVLDEITNNFKGQSSFITIGVGDALNNLKFVFQIDEKRK